MKRTVDDKGFTLEEFLQNYKAKDYPKPSVTADIVLFSIKENKVDGIGIVSATKLTDEQTYKFTLNIIPMIEEVKVKNEYTSVINHLTPMEYRDLLYGIRKFCPYISSIEGIRELMWPKQKNETLIFFPSKNYKFELYKNDIALLYNMYKFSVFIVKTVEKF